MPRRKRKHGARQQPKKRHAAAKALGSPLYRQRVKPAKRRRLSAWVTPIDLARILMES